MLEDLERQTLARDRAREGLRSIENAHNEFKKGMSSIPTPLTLGQHAGPDFDDEGEGGGGAGSGSGGGGGGAGVVVVQDVEMGDDGGPSREEGEDGEGEKKENNKMEEEEKQAQ
jgi:hypothetical protein